ncbi:MAG TPA: SRPBCC family protein [Acetobacteraceae bacterium]|nr:SRPBCC family protein [Acetobacteraceae bacterium]
MARAYASRIIPAPVEALWPIVRDFNALPSWHPAIKSSEIEDGRDADTIGAIRSFTLADGAHVRERLLELDDCRYRFRYNFEKPAFPVANYISTFTLIPLTDRDATFAEWRADFDEPSAEPGRYVDIISNAVFAGGLSALAEKAAGRAVQAGTTRWQGFRPAKVFCAALIHGPIAEVWRRIRDFAGMGDWHPDIHEMRMLDGARSDKVGGTRDFRAGDNGLHEQLTLLSDHRHTFRYRITKTTMPWLNYHAGVRLYPVTATNETLAVWTADWTASPNDDLALIPTVHHDVFQRAFDTLNERFFARSA